MKEECKTCRICNETKPLKDFRRSPTCKQGRAGTCTKCSNGTDKAKAGRKEYAKRNPDKVKSISLKWREQNREAERERVKAAYRKKHNIT